MRAEEIKATMALYWRYVRQCPIVALEVDSQLEPWNGEPADLLVVNKSRRLIETEVKVSLADLKRETKKKKHHRFTTGHPCTAYFYFAVPQEIANKAKPIVDELFPYAGIFGCNGSNPWRVSVYRPAKVISWRKLDYAKMLRIVYGQSSTVARFATQIQELLTVQRNLLVELKTYKDMERLDKERS